MKLIGEEDQLHFRIWTIYAARHMADQEVRITIGNITRNCWLIMDCLVGKIKIGDLHSS